MQYIYEVYLDGRPYRKEKLYHSDRDYKVDDILTPMLGQKREIIVAEREEVNKLNDKNELITAKLYCEYGKIME